MNKKLTLRLDDRLVDSAKEYSARTGKSLSRIVADLFEIIKNEKTNSEEKISPTVQSLKGALKEGKIDKDDYKKYLEEKFL